MDEGAEAVLYAILDAVVDGYAPVVAGIANDIDEIETQVFDGDPKVSRRVYELNREVIEFERAVAPLIGIIDVLSSRVRRRLRRARSCSSTSAMSPTTSCRRRSASRSSACCCATSWPSTRPSSASARPRRRSASREASNRQADQTRKISGWAAILFAPSLIGSIYGMNFDFMWELRSAVGLPGGARRDGCASSRRAVRRLQASRVAVVTLVA